MMPYPTILDTIGNTPLVRLQHINPNPLATILVKLEFLNPSASIKDRMVLHMVEDAEKKGLLKPGGTIVEGTSGNTGAALAMIAAIKGYRAILVVSEKVSQEKQNTLKAFGAKIVVTPSGVSSDSPDYYVNVAKRLAQEIPGSFQINQYDNPINPEAHYLTTGPEIWKQTNGHIDYFIASGSTGGTISGVGKYLKEKNPKVKIILPDPVGSVFYDFFKTGKVPKDAIGSKYIEGIGQNHITKAIDFSVIDDVMQVKEKDAFATGKLLAQKEGILAGGSSGANVWAALEIAKRIKTPTTLVTVLPDSGLKYLSKMYDEEWLKKHHLT
ncbi:MAG TPA: cysteine synthase family protein [Chlamydiales bacterium]|nr:cysteine synthase family protein [Chlamydiales bacterium]